MELRWRKGWLSSEWEDTGGDENIGVRSGLRKEVLKSLNGLPVSFHLTLTLIGIFTIVGLVLYLFWIGTQKCVKKQVRRRCRKKNGGSYAKRAIIEFRVFTNEEIVEATKDFNPNRLIAKGAQGKVFKACNEYGEDFAVKILKSLDKKHVEQFIEEAAILSQIKHDNIVALAGVCLEFNQPILVYQYIQGGTLVNFIADLLLEGHIEFGRICEVFKQLTSALSYLHEGNERVILHRDLKLENVLIDKYWHPFLADFGLAKIQESEEELAKRKKMGERRDFSEVVGTLPYMAPEVWKRCEYSEKSDIYALGMIMGRVLTGKSRGEFMEDYYFALKTGKDEDVDKLFIRGISKGAQNKETVAHMWKVAKVVWLCLHPDPNIRADLNTVNRALNDEPLEMGPPEDYYNYSRVICVPIDLA